MNASIINSISIMVVDIVILGLVFVSKWNSNRIERLEEKVHFLLASDDCGCEQCKEARS